MEANDIFHHGWASAYYVDKYKKEVSFIIENENDFQELAARIGISEAAIPKILNDINLNDRKIVIIYIVTPASNVSYGVRKIESIASKIHIKVMELECPNTMGSATMGGQVLVLSAPKNEPEIAVNVENFNVLDEPEYEAWNYKECKQRVSQLEKATSVNKKAFQEIYMYVYGGESDEDIKQQSSFKEIEDQDQAEKILKAVREAYILEKKVQATFQEVSKRLKGKSYNQTKREMKNRLKHISSKEVDGTLSVKDGNKRFQPLYALGILSIVGIVGVFSAINLSHR